ncbi:MAG: ABC transporter substrate-binding protein [Acidithiobacillus sp.]|nr:ABC transporter substrate-binding protein [Acidithiobacillus sp.]
MFRFPRMVTLLALVFGLVPSTTWAVTDAKLAAETDAGVNRSPDAAIQALDNALLASMKAGAQAGYAGRYKIIAPVLDQVFNFARIAELTLGSEWQKLTAAERQEFVHTFRDYTAATYAARFDSFSGEKFAITDTQSLQPMVKAVFTTFTEKSGKIHRFDYLLQLNGGKWQVINVVADGVSDLSLKRAEYTDTIRKKGFPALIAHLQNQIKKYAAGTKS